MNRTYTPELKPDVLDRLAAYAASFRDDFNRPRQAAWCGTYLRGLIQDGDRKSVEPMAARVPLPEGLDVADPDQALQQFLGQSTWDERAVLRRYRATMAAKFADPAGIFVIDDTTFPKQGKHSVGVQRQYCGALGKGIWSRVVFGDFSGGGLLPDAVFEDCPFDDLGQQRRTVQRSPAF